MYQTVKYTKDAGIGIVTINRPEALNALNSTVIAELEQLVTELENDRELRAVILTGEGRSFVAGADIGEQQPLTLDGGRRWGQRGSAAGGRKQNRPVALLTPHRASAQIRTDASQYSKQY